MLFSDIGTRFYTDLGFRALPADEYMGRLPPAPRPDDDLTMRPARESDLDRIAQAHRASSASRPCAIERDQEHWQFLWVRSRSFFSRVQGAGKAATSRE